MNCQVSLLDKWYGGLEVGGNGFTRQKRRCELAGLVHDCFFLPGPEYLQ